MDFRNSKIEKFFSILLPFGAEIITYLKQSVRLGDLDGDGKFEAVVAYTFMGKQYLSIFKKQGYYWYNIGHTPGKIYRIYDFHLRDCTGDGKKDIIVKWKIDDMWYELNVWTWMDGTLKKVVNKKEPFNVPRKKIELYPASRREIEGVRYGYIDSSGKLIIPIKFDSAEDFQENGLAIVRINDKAGAIDEFGNYVIQPKYSDIQGFKEKRAIVTDNQKYKVIDESGKELFENDNFISEFYNGRALFSIVEKGDQWKYGYINLQGKVVVPPQFLSAGNFSNGRAVVQLENEKYGVIDLNGKILKTFPYEQVTDISEGRLFFKEKIDGKFGLMDENGQIIVAPKYGSVESFKNGTAIVGEGDTIIKFGVINRNGEYTIQPKYNRIDFLGEDRFAVGIPIKDEANYMPSKYAISDSKGKVLTGFIYYGVSEYKNNLASVYDNKFTYFIDKQGKRVDSLPKVEGSGTLTLLDNIIKANVDYRLSYYDKAGKLIWRQNTEVPLNNGYILNEEKYKPNRDYLVYYPQLSGAKDKNKERIINDELKKLSNLKDVGSEQLDYSYLGGFDITFYKKDLLVLELWGYNYPFGAAHGMPTQIYVHINLKNGDFYELKDLFKKNSNYVKRLSDIIQKQIDKKGEELGIWKDQYEGIKPNQPFYVTEDALHIYFDPYEIAPYSSGFVTFDIPFTEIMDIIDTKGGFWRAFH
ncbi:WG repeat-containing protein [Clostridium sp. PL3]|uniref:WG repeat-containing protein n=1 Tax=Clostridium thailandense TaxID=2794346 RepID=A0A949TNI7_9CLOT|nr:WG repeat-containing protein [Clostridium thailandense]MBV7272532.1 WG repeat-containing protein [Clostridium thailandense]